MTNLEKDKASKRRRKALRVVFNELESQSDDFGNNAIRDSIVQTLNDTMYVVTHNTSDEFHVKEMKDILHRLGQLRDIVSFC